MCYGYLKQERYSAKEDKTHCVEMGNLSYSKQPPPVVFVQTVEHADGNPYSKTNTVSILDLHSGGAPAVRSSKNAVSKLFVLLPKRLQI